MNRRRFITALGASTVVGLAGCAGRRAGVNEETTVTTTATTTATAARTPDPAEVELPVPREDLRRGAAKDAIPAITNPNFGTDWSDVEATLEDEEGVIGVVRDGIARAYPIPVLDWHEIINDDLGGPLLVTYCPLCGSGMTAVRTVRGEETLFGVSGFLYKNDLVMYDLLTETLWSQILARGINGPQVGETLRLVPSSLTTWGAWREEHPDTEVLLPPPLSSNIADSPPRNYDRYPYGSYEESNRIGIGSSSFEDDRLHPKASVVGVRSNDVAKAYPFAKVTDEGVVNDTVGDLPVVVATGPDETLSAFVRRVDGRVLQFAPDGDRHMSAGGSSWSRATGVAVDGPLEESRLEQANDTSTQFWFAWLDFNPDTVVYGVDDRA